VDATAFPAASRAFFFIPRGSPFSVTRSLRVIVRLRRMGTVEESEKDMRCYWKESDGWIEKRWMTLAGTGTYIGFLILYSTRWLRQLNPFENIENINILRIRSCLGRAVTHHCAIYIGKTRGKNPPKPANPSCGWGYNEGTNFATQTPTPRTLPTTHGGYLNP
jgi:hypothetical protein